MRSLALLSLAFVSLAALARPAVVQVVVGQKASAFTATDTEGRTRSLSEFQGKVVVLEWWNPQCPFVGKHYGSGHMQKLQKEWTARGVVWLTIDSSAPGEQGNVDAAQANALIAQRGAQPTALLLDPQGTVGRAYGARTTPHMFVIDATGTVVYAGGIDDKPSTDREDIATAHNFVEAALAEVTSGRKVSTATSRPYGCSVKYKS